MDGTKLDVLLAELNTLDGCELEAVQAKCKVRLQEMGWYVSDDGELGTSVFADIDDGEDLEAELELVEYYDNHEDELDEDDNNNDESGES